jgi:hypothetical protein
MRIEPFGLHALCEDPGRHDLPFFAQKFKHIPRQCELRGEARDIDRRHFLWQETGRDQRYDVVGGVSGNSSGTTTSSNREKSPVTADISATAKEVINAESLPSIRQIAILPLRISSKITAHTLRGVEGRRLTALVRRTNVSGGVSTLIFVCTANPRYLAEAA